MNLSKTLAFLLLLGATNKGAAQNDTVSIFYKKGIFELSPAQSYNLNLQMKALPPDASYKINIIGSADAEGKSSSNQVLSEKRAFGVYQHIKEFFEPKIASIEYKGYGEPATKNTSSIEQGNAEDRKVTVFFEAMPQVKTELSKRLGELEVGEYLILENFKFQSGKHYLEKESVPYLFELLEILKNYPQLHIEIQGHVWAFYIEKTEEGIAKAQELSEGRAKNIYDFLVKNGISSDRLVYKGYGIEKQLPLSTKDPSRNRRVEILILQK